MTAANFTAAVLKWVKAGRPARDDQGVESLLEICKSCPSDKYNAAQKVCSQCGCKLNLSHGLNKLRWATESCPLNHWDAWVDEQGVTPAGRDAEQRGWKRRRRQRVSQQDQAMIADAERAAAEQQRQQDERDARDKSLAKLERQLQREARARRRERRRKRRERIAAKQAAEAARTPDQKWVNPDPLIMFTRHKEPATLKDMWRNTAGFLVCGGPSLKQLDLEPLRERGIVSLAVNNVAGWAPVRAMTFSDPAEKFHHGIFLDPAMMKFVPTPKLKEHIRVKMPDGSFKPSNLRVRDCPNVWAYKRDCFWTPESFLDQDGATWGNNNKGVAKTGREKLLFTFFLGLRLLHYFGVRRVYLLGVDFGMDPRAGDHENYAFGEERWKGACASNNNSYRTANKWCHEMRPHLDATGWQIYNCNAHSKLTAFEHVPYETALTDCRGHTPAEPFDLVGWYRKPGSEHEMPDDRGDSPAAADETGSKP